MGFRANFSVKKNDTDKLLTALKKAFRDEVLVGIPEKESSRPNGPLNNAEIAYLNTEGIQNGEVHSQSPYSAAMNAYLHTHGSPFQNVPPRPFLIPALEDCRADLTRKLNDIVQTGLEGKNTRPGFMALGLFAQRKIKDWFTDPKNGWPPNAPLTVKLKGSSRPMIDTGQLRNSINFVIETK